MNRLFQILAIASVWIYYGAFRATEFYDSWDTTWKLVYFAVPIALFFGGLMLLEYISHRQVHKEHLRRLAQRSNKAYANQQNIL